MTNMLTSRMSPWHREKLSELVEMFKKNWLKSVGLIFVIQACVEYLVNHMFSCLLTGAVLLMYGTTNCAQKCGWAKKTGKANEASFYLLFAWASWVGAIVALVIAAQVAPPNVVADFQFIENSVKRLFNQ